MKYYILLQLYIVKKKLDFQAWRHLEKSERDEKFKFNSVYLPATFKPFSHGKISKTISKNLEIGKSKESFYTER